MRFKVSSHNEEDKILDDIESLLDYCISDDYHSDDDYFEDWVNDREGSITINDERYYAYDILREMDYSSLDALRDQYIEDQNDSDRDEAKYKIRHSDIGDEIYIQDHCVKLIEDEIEDTGDFDGDALDCLRAELQKQLETVTEQQKEIKKTEDDLMKMIQVVGG